MSSVTSESRRLSAAEQVQVRLLRQLLDTWTAGSQLPPIRELANEFGSGYVNTHKAVQELVSSGLLRSQHRVGVFVSDQLDPRQVKAHLSQLREPTMTRPARHLAGVAVRLVLPHHQQDEFVVRMANQFTVQMQTMGASVMRLHDESRETLDVSGLEQRAVALFHPVSKDVKLSEEQAMVAVCTTVGPRFHPPTHVDVVTVDQDQGGELAGRYLRERGFTTACYFGVHRSGKDDRRDRTDAQASYDPTSTTRLEGFERGWGAAIPARHRLVCDSFMVESAAASVRKYLRLNPRPRAVFTATDDLALGVYYGAIAHGLVPGRDIHIMGFDGQAAGTRLARGSLCTVEVPAEQMGREAAALLSERLRHPKVPAHRVRLGCTVREGHTVCAET